MGAQQSSPRDTPTGSAPKKTDYYELLGVERTATGDEIKKAYRKKALELHPDRNFGDVENATRKFAEVQAAYEVLSDTQERAWYDSHSDAILRGDDPNDFNAAPEFRNVRVITVNEIFTLMGRFNKSVPLDDSPNSFFTVLRDMFDRLADAEYAAVDAEGGTISDFPTFGESQDDDAVAKTFYSHWSNFSTRLDFAWTDKYRLSDAPDRRVRRLMEKENKKVRDAAIREFNNAVQSLVIFVQKRDPRYIPNNQTEAERQKILRDAAAAQAARSRAAHLEKMNDADAVPEWVHARGEDDNAGEFSESEEESEVEEIECVVCNKSFKSEKQFEAHEKSKKHIKAVQQLKRQMKAEDMDFDLGQDAKPKPFVVVEPERAPTPPSRGSDSPQEVDDKADAEPVASISTTPQIDTNSEDDDYASRDAVEARLVGKSDPSSENDGDDIDGMTAKTAKMTVESNPPAKKIGMAKAKKMKKAARQAAAEQEGHPCVTCRASFDSKSNLFKHLKDFPDHAAIKTAPTSKKAGKKRR